MFLIPKDFKYLKKTQLIVLKLMGASVFSVSVFSVE